MTGPPAFLLDQDVYEATFRPLVAGGHACTRARDAGLASVPDAMVLREAFVRKLTLITRDKGFGALVYVGRLPAYGVILLRMTPDAESRVHEQLLKLVTAESQGTRLRDHLFTVEADGYRVRAMPRPSA